jgi:hypothetical protein
MPSVNRKTDLWKFRRSESRPAAEEWTYPTGMVWCPMKMSGIAVMRCADLQKEFGCGTIRQFRMITTAVHGHVPFYWPWLRRRRECPQRASDEEVRELRLALSPLKPVDKIRKNPRAYRCPGCGGRKAFGARQCRGCWRVAVRR